MNVQIINNRKFFLISVNLISTEITAESKKPDGLTGSTSIESSRVDLSICPIHTRQVDIKNRRFSSISMKSEFEDNLQYFQFMFCYFKEI